MGAAVFGVGLVGAQAGHLLAFQLRFGSAAQHLQSSGAHAYFPNLVKTTLGAVAIAVLVALFVIGLARALNRRSPVRLGASPNYLEVLAALFTIQLACFISQEVVEAAVVGTAVGPAADLLLWGTLGQLPVSAIGAVALGWLWTRFESALEELRAVLAIAKAQEPAAVSLAEWHLPDRALLLAQVAGSSLDKRGPPSPVRTSS